VPAPIRIFAVLVAAGMLAAACSSGSSGSGGAASPTPTDSGSVRIDESAVDAAMSHVLSGLRSATSISASSSITSAARSLDSASSELQAGANGLNPPPAGVPSAKSLAVSTGLLRIAGLLKQSANCLAVQARAKTPSTARCLPPLRRAERRDASIARGLISIAVYGSTSPKAFERKLVAALHGK
jgi:hypothetical protein